MLVKVFKGQWRGIGNDKGDAHFAQVGFKFREYIHFFKGPRLHVFMVIMLHMNEDGLSFPSYDTMQEETGYKRTTIAKTIDELCETQIEGRPILLKWRNRNERGQYVGPNQYKVFPTKEEIEQLKPDQSSENPTLVKPNVGSVALEEEPINKEEPSKKEEESVSKADEKPKEPKKPKDLEKANLSQHPAIQAFRRATHLCPAKSWYQDIIDAVGDDTERWHDIAKDWVGLGYKPTNVKGMLDVYKNGWSSQRSNGSNGSRPPSTPGTIPKGMEKENRSDIKKLTPEQQEKTMKSILAQRQARKEQEEHERHKDTA